MRLSPREVAPVTHNGITYRVCHWGAGENGGGVEACDSSTGVLLWKVMVYITQYDQSLETDAQDVFIKTLAVEGNHVQVKDELHREFLIDLETREFREIPNRMGHFQKIQKSWIELRNSNTPFGSPRQVGTPEEEARLAGDLLAELVELLEQHSDIEVRLRDRVEYFSEAGRSQQVRWILLPLLELEYNQFLRASLQRALAEHPGLEQEQPSPHESAARTELSNLDPARLQEMRSLGRITFQGLLGDGMPTAATLGALSDLVRALQRLRAPLWVEAGETGEHLRDVLGWGDANIKASGGLRYIVAGLRRWALKVASLFP